MDEHTAGGFAAKVRSLLKSEVLRACIQYLMGATVRAILKIL